MLSKEEISQLKKKRRQLFNKALFHKRQRKLLMSEVHHIDRILKSQQYI